MAAFTLMLSLLALGCADRQHIPKAMIGGSGYDAATKMVSMHDGGFAVIGVTKSNDGNFKGLHKGSSDAFLIRFDSLGRILWRETYGGNGIDGARAIAPLKSGGFVLAGYARSANGQPGGAYRGEHDALLIRTDSAGHRVGSVLLGGSQTESANSVTVAGDGGSTFAGATNSNNGDFSGHDLDGQNMFITRYDSSGNATWSRLYGGAGDDGAWSSCIAADNGIVVVGETNSSSGVFPVNRGMKDVAVMKINSTGEVLWSRTYGGERDEVARDAVALDDGGYAITGWTKSTQGDLGATSHDSTEIFVFRLNAEGVKKWATTIGGSDNEWGNSILQTPDGGFVVVGSSQSTDGNFSISSNGKIDIVVCKLSPLGNIDWIKRYGGSGDDHAVSVVSSHDGGLIVCGGSTSNNGDFDRMNNGDSDMFILKLDRNGNLHSMP